MKQKQKQWTEEEEEYLIENFKSNTTLSCALHLERTVNSVEKKASRMGLKHEYEDDVFTPEMAINTEKEKLKNQGKDELISSLVKMRASNELIIDIIKEVLPKCNFAPEKINIRPINKSHEEQMVMHLTDVHIGRYSESTLRKKISILYEAIIKYLNMYRSSYKINKLNIFLTGDIVDGDGIFSSQTYEQKFYLMDQIYKYGVPLFTNLFNQLSNHFPEIEISCVHGNHGRINKFTSPEINFDSILYECIRLATESNKRIKWNISWDWYNYATIYNYNFLLIHGNQIKTWMNLPFYGMKEKAMRWKGSLERDFNYVFAGHFHTKLNFVWNDFEAFIGGTWLDNDAWAEEELGMKSSNSQRLLLISEKRGIVSEHTINLSTKI